MHPAADRRRGRICCAGGSRGWWRRGSRRGRETCPGPHSWREPFQGVAEAVFGLFPEAFERLAEERFGEAGQALELEFRAVDDPGELRLAGEGHRVARHDRTVLAAQHHPVGAVGLLDDVRQLGLATGELRDVAVRRTNSAVAGDQSGPHCARIPLLGGPEVGQVLEDSLRGGCDGYFTFDDDHRFSPTCSAAWAMLRCMPPKTTSWNGRIAAQYSSPGRPRGWNSARCRNSVRP